MGDQGSGPANKWVAVKISGLTGDQQANALSQAAKLGFTQTPIATHATDGEFVQVAGYEDENKQK